MSKLINFLDWLKNLSLILSPVCITIYLEEEND